MEPEYDFSGAEQGKYFERFKKMRLKVLIEPDVAQTFPDSASVNSALRRATPGRAVRSRVRAISETEREVLRMLAQNFSASTMAEKLASRQRTLEGLVEKLTRYVERIESSPKGRASKARR